MWVLILLLVSFVSHAKPLLLTQEYSWFDSPTRAVFYDATGTLSFAEVKAKAADFQQVENDLSFGYATGVYWLTRCAGAALFYTGFAYARIRAG